MESVTMASASRNWSMTSFEQYVAVMSVTPSESESRGVPHMKHVRDTVGTCVAACWSVLQCVAVYCSSQKGVLCLNHLHDTVGTCVAVCCSVLQCVAVCCSVLQ